MGTILEPPGQTQDNSSVPSKMEYKKSQRKYSETIDLQNDGFSSNLQSKSKIVASNSLIDPATASELLENSSNTDDTKPQNDNIEEVEEQSDSSTDADRFLKAAQENASSTISEK